MDIFQENFIKLLNEIDLVDLDLTSVDENSIISQLTNYEPYFFGFTKIIPTFERLTVNKRLPENLNTRIWGIKLLKYPPHEIITKFGRANLKFQSVLYGTFQLPTTLAEMNPQLGDIVTTSIWELKEPETCLFVCPIINSSYCRDIQLLNEFEKGIRNYPIEFRELIRMDYELISKCFSKEVDKDKDINYIFSAAFANWIFNKFNNGKIEAILYPSVQDSTRSDNIAIKPEAFDLKYKIKEIRESKVISRGTNTIFLKEINTTNKVDQYGQIIWE